jgi:HK97 family phage prohead protease
MIEFKTSGVVKDVDVSKRIVTGYFTSTGTLDSDADIFAEGAFKKTINDSGPKGKNRIWHLWQHDQNQPINKPYLLEERKEGVYFETQLINTPVSQMALALYEAQAITEHSVGFMTIKSDDEKEARIIKEVRMLEGSSVLWGANENTPTVAMKAEEAMRQISALEKLLKTGAFKQDEIFELIELQIAQIKSALQPPKALEPQGADEAGKTTSKHWAEKFTLITIKT